MDSDEEYKKLPSLYYLARHQVALLMLKAWDFHSNEINSYNVVRVKKECHQYFNLSPDISFHIVCAMLIQNEFLTFGQALWVLESSCDRIYMRWFTGLSLETLCEIASREAQDTILELFITSDDDVSEIHTACCFRNLRRLKICGNNEVRNWQVEQIVLNCKSLEDLSLKGCSNINDDFCNVLWKTRHTQENLRVIDISDTSITGAMASTIYFLLPQLMLLLYDYIASFLRYRCNPITNENLSCNPVIHTVRLGSTGDHRLRYVTEDERVYKEMEVSFPNYDMALLDGEGHKNVFSFYEDEQETFRFQDVYLAMSSVASHMVFGVLPQNSYLKELSLTSVRDIDLNVLFSQFPKLKKICLWRDCSITSSGLRTYFSESVTDVEFWFVSSDVINKTLKYCPNLEYLIIRRVKLAIDTFKGVCFKNIKLVEISHCEGYSKVDNVFPLQAEVDIY